MLVVVRKSYPDMVFATHRESQIRDVLSSYSDEDFDVLRTEAACASRDPVPAGAVAVDRSAEGGNG